MIMVAITYECPNCHQHSGHAENCPSWYELFCHSCNRPANTACVEQGHRTSPSWTHGGLDCSDKNCPCNSVNKSPAPRAGERYGFVIFTGRFKVLDYHKADGQQMATADGEDEARIIVRALNATKQHATLVEQRERLLQIARDALQDRVEMNGHCNHDEYMVKLCSQCEIRQLLATIEQEGEASR